jgi:hypothetical protein
MTDDQSRQVATSPDDYTLTIEDAALRYDHAGHPRTNRTIQRYCAKGHLDCLRQETQFGDKYLITPASVARHISQIVELASMTGRDLSRPVGASVAAQELRETGMFENTTGSDKSRPVAADDRYVTQLETENTFLKTQVSVKDTQIAALLERDHETNALINGLQRMLGPLLAAPPKADPGPQQPAT